MKSEPKLPDNEMAIPNTPAVERLLAMMVEANIAANKVQNEQLRQTRKKSNDFSPEISEYNPRGQKDFPMPDLKCEVLMPWPLRKGFQHGLTREEVELMNLIEPGEYVISLLDGTEVTCSVLGTKNTVTRKIERLAFMGAYDVEANLYATLYTKERRTSFPSMVFTLREILEQKGIDHAKVMTMKEEKRRIALPVEHELHLAVSVGE